MPAEVSNFGEWVVVELVTGVAVVMANAAEVGAAGHNFLCLS